MVDSLIASARLDMHSKLLPSHQIFLPGQPAFALPALPLVLLANKKDPAVRGLVPRPALSGGELDGARLFSVRDDRLYPNDQHTLLKGRFRHFHGVSKLQRLLELFT